MFGGPGRPEGFIITSSGTRSHHYSQGKHSHEWREAPAWRGKEILHSQSSPALMGVPYEGQEVLGDGHRPVSASQHRFQQQHSFNISIPPVPTHQPPVPKDSGTTAVCTLMHTHTQMG